MIAWTPRRLKILLNLYPPYLFTGIRVTDVDSHWRSLDVRMRLRWYNRNVVGTHFGGSLYAMVDPHAMLLLLQRLGPHYVVWDDRAAIDFRKPGKGTVRCRVEIPDAMVEEIRARTGDGAPFRPVLDLAVVDEEGDVVAEVRKVLYVRKKRGEEDGGG